MREHDIERIKELWERGATQEEIARELGVNKSTVFHWVRKLNKASLWAAIADGPYREGWKRLLEENERVK